MDTLIKNDLTVGTGEIAVSGQVIRVHYTGWVYDEKAEENKGELFDSSVPRNDPFEFVLGSGMVIKGWDEGFVDMKVGGKRQLVIPPDMGYGANGIPGAIPPNATLLFEVELLEVN